MSVTTPSLMTWIPPNGNVVYSENGCAILSVAHDLCKIVAFLQSFELSPKLQRFDDWWEHDGLQFARGQLDIHGLFEIVGTPRSLICSMTGDERVFVGVSIEDRSWYLRFFADWDDRGEFIVGEYSIALSPTLEGRFATEVLPSLECPVNVEMSSSYFVRISAA